MFKFVFNFLIISKVSFRFLFIISLTRLLKPIISTKFFCFNPICSILKLIAEIGSGISTGKFSLS